MLAANVPPTAAGFIVWIVYFGNTPESRSAARSKFSAERNILLNLKALCADMSNADKGRLPLELMDMVRE